MARKLTQKARDAKNYKLDPNSEGDAGQKKIDSKWVKRWLWIIVFFIFAFTAGIIVIGVIALEENGQNLPDDIDVVLHVLSGEPGRSSRYVAQARVVREHMKWVRNVYVLHPTETGEVEESQITFVTFSGTDQQAFEFMPDIPGISDNAIFMSDRTLPFRKIEKRFLFFNGQPRMFNIFREQSEVNFFSDYLELPTLPTLVTDLVKLKEPPQTWTDLVFREVTEDRITLRTDLNRDIMVVSTMVANAQKQFDKLTNNPPYFATFHVNSGVDPDPEASYALINSYFETL